ncbi:MAG TPA: diacylglycerol kinase family protein [Candidatus Angelobacter sp.]|nr:diacylglycerol kinase family protein [Candidatus Angelobacter sp.]
MRVATLSAPGVSQKTIQQFKCSPEIDLSSAIHPTQSPHSALIFGGDGTVHRYLPQICSWKIPMLVVPKGTGNDFAHSLRISSERVALRAWQQFCSGAKNVREIDLGLIRNGTEEIPFCCVVSAGMDADANARANRMPSWVRSSVAYLFAAVQSLLAFRPVDIEVTTDARHQKRQSLLIAVGNAHRYGGGIKIAPRAVLDDGLLDVCLVGRISKLKVLFCLPIIYFGGHTRLKEVEYFQASKVRIETNPALELYADGEPACRTPVEISLIPRGLQVIVPLERC